MAKRQELASQLWKKIFEGPSFFDEYLQENMDEIATDLKKNGFHDIRAPDVVNSFVRHVPDLAIYDLKYTLNEIDDCIESVTLYPLRSLREPNDY